MTESQFTLGEIVDRNTPMAAFIQHHAERIIHDAKRHQPVEIVETEFQPDHPSQGYYLCTSYKVPTIRTTMEELIDAILDTVMSEPRSRSEAEYLLRERMH